MKCAVATCNNSQKNKGIGFHSFPKDKKLLRQWVHFCKRNVKPKFARICSEHFPPEDFERNFQVEMGFSKFKTIKLGAVPTVNKTDVLISDTLRSSRALKRNNKKMVAELLEKEVNVSPLKQWKQDTRKDTNQLDLINEEFYDENSACSPFINEELYDDNTVDIPEHTSSNIESVPAVTRSSTFIQRVDESCSTLYDHQYTKEIIELCPKKTTRVCGLVEVILESKTYTMNCFYCAAKFPLWSWSKFVNHMKEEHKNFDDLSESGDDFVPEEPKVAPSKQSKDAIHNAAKSAAVIKLSGGAIARKMTSISPTNQQETTKFTTSFNSSMDIDYEQYLDNMGYDGVDDSEERMEIERLQDDDDDEQSENEDYWGDANFEKDSNFSDVDMVSFSAKKRGNPGDAIKMIRFGLTDHKLVLDFLDMLKLYPVLWSIREKPCDLYDFAIEQLTEAINEKWKCTISPLVMRVSLYRICEWYRSVLVETEKRRVIANKVYRTQFEEYFEKCEEILTKPPIKVCDICNDSFYTERWLQQHQNKYHAATEFAHKCSVCSYTFSTKEKSHEHEQREHQKNHDEIRYTCNICSEGFFHKHLLSEHRVKHKTCFKCNRVFNSVKRYQKHEMLHKVPTLKCELCPKMYHWQERLEEHMKFHRNQRDHVCEHCGKTFLRQNTLSLHRKRYHFGGLEEEKKRKYECQICGAIVGNSSLLHDHRIKFHLVREGTIEELMQAPLRRRKPRVPHVVDRETQKRRYLCNVCGNTYGWHGGLYRHKVRAHGHKHKGIAEDPEPDTCIIGEDGHKLYRCDYCGKISPHKLAVRAHKAKKHGVRAFCNADNDDSENLNLNAIIKRMQKDTTIDYSMEEGEDVKDVDAIKDVNEIVEIVASEEAGEDDDDNIKIEEVDVHEDAFWENYLI